jgi:hypothetical protein
MSDRYQLVVNQSNLYIVDTTVTGVGSDPKILAQTTDASAAVQIVRALNKEVGSVQS